MNTGITIDNVAVREFPASFTFGPHAHRFVEVDFIERGSCGMLFGTELVRLTTNDCLLILPDVPHYFFTHARSPCTIVQLEFAVDDFSLDLLGDIKAPSRRFLKFIPHESLSYCIRNIRYEHANNLTGSEKMMQLLFDQFFLLLNREIARVFDDKMFLGDKVTPLLKNLVDTLHNEYEDEISIEGLAATLGVSSRYLRAQFRRGYGMTISDFLLGLRIRKASTLLSQQKRSILEVAIQSGFASSQYFARIFKKEGYVTVNC